MFCMTLVLWWCLSFWETVMNRIDFLRISNVCKNAHTGMFQTEVHLCFFLGLSLLSVGFSSAKNSLTDSGVLCHLAWTVLFFWFRDCVKLRQLVFYSCNSMSKMIVFLSLGFAVSSDVISWDAWVWTVLCFVSRTVYDICFSALAIRQYFRPSETLGFSGHIRILIVF